MANNSIANCQYLPTVQYSRLRGAKKSRRKLTGLRALYYRYLYELGALPRKPRRPSYAVRQDVYKLDQRIRQMEFLSKNNIDTLEQLETYRQERLTEIDRLIAEKAPTTDNAQNERIKQLRREEKLCRKIAEQSIEVKQHLNEAHRKYSKDESAVTESQLANDFNRSIPTTNPSR